MATAVQYYELNALDAANLYKCRCQYLMDNQMQCPTHGSYGILANTDTGEPIQYICTYHFNFLQIVRTSQGTFTYEEVEEPLESTPQKVA